MAGSGPLPIDFLFVCGDMGGAQYYTPVIRTLEAQERVCSIFADIDGQAKKTFVDNGVSHTSVTHPHAGFLRKMVQESKAIVVNTDASAYHLSRLVADMAQEEGKILVLTNDGYFNHGFGYWRDISKGIWFVIDEGHQELLRKSHPQIAPENIRIVGQPAFDNVRDIIPQKNEIRSTVRKTLGTSEDRKLAVWWSTGMAEIAEDDFMMLGGSLIAFGNYGNVDLAVRLHPKLNKTVRPGYVEETRAVIEAEAHRVGVRIVDTSSIDGLHLCLASDLILSITCTEDIRSTSAGGPPVIHFLTEGVRHWFETSLHAEYPYLPDIISGTGIAVKDGPELGNAIYDVLSKRLVFGRENSSELLSSATQRVVKELENLL